MTNTLREIARRAAVTGIPDLIPAVLTLSASDDPRVPPLRTACVLCRETVTDEALPGGLHVIHIAAFPDEGTPPEGWTRSVTRDPDDPAAEWHAISRLSHDEAARLLGQDDDSCIEASYDTVHEVTTLLEEVLRAAGKDE